MTERDVQNIVADAIAQPRDLAIVPNCTALGHESDLLRLTEKHMIHEIEIKVSRSDFLADANKHRNHKFNTSHPNDYGKAGLLPNYFWYALPPDIATLDELPTYAGLLRLHLNKEGQPTGAHIEKRAKRLHPTPANTKLLNYLFRGQRLRYWSEREGTNPTRDKRERAKREQRDWQTSQTAERKGWNQAVNNALFYLRLHANTQKETPTKTSYQALEDFKQTLEGMKRAP